MTKTQQPAMTNEEACKVLVTIEDEFPQSLASQYLTRHWWSESQRRYAHEIAGREREWGCDAANIHGMFNKALAKLTDPSIVFEFDDINLVFRWSQRKVDVLPRVVVTTRTPLLLPALFMGSVSTGSLRFQPSKHCTQDVADFIKAFNSNPAHVVTTYGHKRGRCCFCVQKLTDERSLKAGFGPVCARHWGLSAQWKAATGSDAFDEQPATAPPTLTQAVI